MKKVFLLLTVALISLSMNAQRASLLGIDTDKEQQAPIVYDSQNGPVIKSSLRTAQALNLPAVFQYPQEVFSALEVSPWWNSGKGYSFNLAFTWRGLYWRRNDDNNQWLPWCQLITTDAFSGNVTIDNNLLVTGGNVGIGTTSPQNKLDVNGTIRAKEVVVETGWADFVFKEDYQLPPLAEVKAHIDEYKHLPGIPSESEVQENGIGLSEISTKLLQKVEELTLYAIQQNEKIESLTREIEELRNQK